MQDTIKKAKDKGLKSLDWITETDSVASQKLAEKSGFTFISRDEKKLSIGEIYETNNECSIIP